VAVTFVAVAFVAVTFVAVVVVVVAFVTVVFAGVRFLAAVLTRTFEIFVAVFEASESLAAVTAMIFFDIFLNRFIFILYFLNFLLFGDVRASGHVDYFESDLKVGASMKVFAASNVVKSLCFAPLKPLPLTSASSQEVKMPGRLPTLTA